MDSDGIRGSDCFLISRLTAHAGRKVRYCGSHLENTKPSVDPDVVQIWHGWSIVLRVRGFTGGYWNPTRCSREGQGSSRLAL